MACTLVDLSAAPECPESDGGIYVTYLADSTSVTDFVFDVDGTVTNVIMTGLGLWFKYEYDDDDTALYNQTGERTNNKHTAAQAAFFKFAGVTKEHIQFANGIKSCCALYAIHFFNSGIAVVQGIDYNATTTLWRKSKQRLKATVNILSDTGENEDRVEINLNSTGRCFSPPTDLTQAAIEAL